MWTGKEQDIAKLEKVEESLLVQGDFFDLLEKLPDRSVDLVLTDLPYSTTILHWDKDIDLERMWKALARVMKENAAAVMFALQPFTSKLVFSNIKDFRYCWVWEKTKAGNFLHARRQPLKRHEDICVFYKKQPTYNPQMAEGKAYSRNFRAGLMSGKLCPLKGDLKTFRGELSYGDERYPHTVLRYGVEGKRVHPTQKPVKLLEYLIRTYSNEGEIVLDLTMGSGTTCVAALQQKRIFVGVELDEDIFSTARDRVLKASGERVEESLKSRKGEVQQVEEKSKEGRVSGFRGRKRFKDEKQCAFDW